MEFIGRTWRPPYEADSCIIQLTSGCSYNACTFCNLYKAEPFSLVSLSVFEKDLQEIKQYQPNTRRLFLTGANPFALSYEKLVPYVLVVHDYLLRCQTIAMFASIRDIKNKTARQLKKLHALGVNGLSIGIESGDEQTLLLANKGYTSKDIINQCKKLDEAGIEYYFVYMTVLAGKNGGYRNAVNTVSVFNRLNPYFVSIDSLTLFAGTKLYDMEQNGLFIPASEKERLVELQIFIEKLQIRTHLLANTKSNYYPFMAYLPKQRNMIISELQYVINATNGMDMQNYRKNLNTL